MRKSALALGARSRNTNHCPRNEDLVPDDLSQIPKVGQNRLDVS